MGKEANKKRKKRTEKSQNAKNEEEKKFKMTPSEIESKIKELLRKDFSKDADLFSLTQPPAHIEADASTNFAIIISKKNKLKPEEVYSKISNILSEHGFKTETASGFINIFFPPKIYRDYINEINSGEKIFAKDYNKSKKTIIEFVSANPTGPLHLASASAASMGDSLSSIMKELGYPVFKEYYVNNVGNQIEMLGKSLMARYLGQDVCEEGYHGDYLIEIAKKLPTEAKEWAEKNEILNFAKFAVNEIIKTQKEDMKLFGVDFDNWFYESELHEKNLPDLVLEKLIEKKAVEEKDGAKWLKMENSEDKERVLVKSNGLKTYFLNDLAYHLTKYERGFEWIIDIWGADHHGYIPRMKAGIKMLGLDEKKFTVLIHQLVSIKKGDEILKMSKRAGTFYTLRRLVEETSKDAVRFFFTTRSPNTHLVFDIELAKKQSNENPLYYVQYAHARISSIMENSKNKNFNPEEINSFGDYEPTPDDKKVIKKIFWFEKILNQCVKDLSPHHITTYLIELAGEFHSYYEKNKIIDETNENSTKARLFILKGIKSSIKKGLELIGVSAPERM
ncbi:MAG TPA: arginine--tRNA ligase [Elusimicrobiales bacterium]|nr:arginine--tRNA ligase [Elusimicrobiales bacterium]